MSDSEEVRVGKGYRWTDSDRHLYSHGFTIDNLDTKSFNEGMNSFEKIFITVRGILLESKEDNQYDEKLQLCHTIARQISIKRREIFECDK